MLLKNSPKSILPQQRPRNALQHNVVLIISTKVDTKTYFIILFYVLNIPISCSIGSSPGHLPSTDDKSK